jgi:hypothetical protein
VPGQGANTTTRTASYVGPKDGVAESSQPEVKAAASSLLTEAVGLEAAGGESDDVFVEASSPGLLAKTAAVNSEAIEFVCGRRPFVVKPSDKLSMANAQQTWPSPPKKLIRRSSSAAKRKKRASQADVRDCADYQYPHFAYHAGVLANCHELQASTAQQAPEETLHP